MRIESRMSAIKARKDRPSPLGLSGNGEDDGDEEEEEDVRKASIRGTKAADQIRYQVEIGPSRYNGTWYNTVWYMHTVARYSIPWIWYTSLLHHAMTMSVWCMLHQFVITVTFLVSDECSSV